MAKEALTRLQSIDELRFDGSADAIRGAELDFGALLRGQCKGVVKPGTVAGLQSLVEFARETGIRLALRGGGTSQSGQSIPNGGLSVDLSSFAELSLLPNERRARCGCSLTWRQLLAATAKHGLAPEVMPLNPDLTIGGTLSAGGLGSTSHRHGMSVCAVEAVEVVTGTGEHLRATRTDHREIYDAVLGGVGRVGVITNVELRLRRAHPRLRTYFLLYDDLPTMLADERELMNRDYCTHLEGFASAAMQGVRVTPAGPEAGRVPFARWFYGLQFSEEYQDSPGDLGQRLEGLNFRELVHTQDDRLVEHAARYAGRFEMMRRTGQWSQPHPWLECFVPYEAAVELLPGLIENLPLVFGDGHRILAVARRPLPGLLMQPEQDPTMGLALLPTSVPSEMLDVALPALRHLHDTLTNAGGKRYLSGWLFEPDEAAWRKHYGSAYNTWVESKRVLDPDNVFSSMLSG